MSSTMHSGGSARTKPCPAPLLRQASRSCNVLGSPASPSRLLASRPYVPAKRSLQPNQGNQVIQGSVRAPAAPQGGIEKQGSIQVPLGNSQALVASYKHVDSSRSTIDTSSDTGKLMENLREEIRLMTSQLVQDLEKRLSVQIDNAKSHLDAKIEALEARVADIPQTESRQLAKFEPHSRHDDETRDEDARGDEKFPGNDTFVTNVADQVIARVNADPRVCRLAESHQALQESFSKLLGVLDEKSPKVSKDAVVEKERDVLREMMLEVQTCCKSIALEVRQTRQRRNQDYSESTVRFEALDTKLKVIEAALALDGSNRCQTLYAEVGSEAVDEQALHPVEVGSRIVEGTSD